MDMQDTIAAIATPLGSGAVAIVRLSGGRALEIAENCFRSSYGKGLRELPGYSGTLGRVFWLDEDIDEAVAYVYRAPRSYTGEDCVELCCHGGSYLVQRVLEICVNHGARPAMPGEFTKRAFLNGKMNLTQAEAVCDLIDAHSEGARRAALSARDGALSTEIQIIVERLTKQSAHLAAWADYPEEDLEPVEPQAMEGELIAIFSKMERLLSTYSQGRVLREGIETAIVGKPNVGKSSLMNLLSGSNTSIVTEIPGTTRDVVQETVQLGDYVLRLLDTAGIRDTQDAIEKQGVELAKKQIQSAQLILAVFDSSLPLNQEDRAVMGSIGEGSCIGVINKTDLPQALDTAEIHNKLGRVVYISAADGSGKEDLEREIAALLKLDNLDTTAAILSNSRQRFALLAAQRSLEEAIDALKTLMTLDAVNVCIDQSLDFLLSITGQRVTENVVDEVFARFCVGK